MFKLYKINLDNLNKELTYRQTNLFCEILFIVSVFVIGLVYVIISKENILSYSIFILFVLCVIFIDSRKLKKCKEKYKIYESLKYNGCLVKDLPYKLKFAGVKENGSKELYIIEAIYKDEYGKEVKLLSDIRFDKKIGSETELIDALIDIQNPQNCYLDFEIEKEV